MTITIPATLSSAMDKLFNNHALVSHSSVCDLLDISTKTLRELGNSGKIVYRLKGTSWRCYAREDVEAFIGRISC
ncbi:MAG: helix-turn-helix domain-containing protein, partial [Hyphomicrobiales bacterium]|nr:helix-turn-helix domain-containing protein [Hyphomicrobiales bacterium]